MRSGLSAARKLSLTTAAVGLAVGCAAGAAAEPDVGVPAPPLPFPKADLILVSYLRVDPADYFVPGVYGVFFRTPSGLNCGIWLKGAFGCRGEYPGAEPGATAIGWNTGDVTVHDNSVVPVNVPPEDSERVLEPFSYIEWNETRCATMGNGSTYCMRGAFKFFITPDGTWLSPTGIPDGW